MGVDFRAVGFELSHQDYIEEVTWRDAEKLPRRASDIKKISEEEWKLI